MRIEPITCSACGGRGRIEVWKVVEQNEQTHSGTAQMVEATCGNCDGKGYMEYPVFSVEEAKAILKYCGLSTEC